MSKENIGWLGIDKINGEPHKIWFQEAMLPIFILLILLVGFSFLLTILSKFRVYI